MAKLNWQTLNRQNKNNSVSIKAQHSHPLNFEKSNMWSLRGKYYGTYINKLPNDYLFWVVDNIKGIHKEIAEGEIYRRYHQLTNT